jgi:hypothetical protein
LRIAAQTFLKAEDGAVTVDWVVLTAAVIGLGMVVISTIGGGTSSMATRTQTSLNAVTVGYANN